MPTEALNPKIISMGFELLKRHTASRQLPGPAAVAIAEPAKSSASLGLSERRKLLRPLPVPEVIECDDDSAWDLWHQSVLKGAF
jgi:hypothetical protein